MSSKKGHHYGVASPEIVEAMSGREFFEAIIAGRLPQPPISQAMSYWLVEIGEGRAVFEGEPGPQLFNPIGTVHGGWALTIIDSATACAGHTLLPAGVGFTTIETKANFSRPITAQTGRVRAEGRVIAQGKQIVSAEATLRSRDGRVLAHGTSTMMVLSARKPRAL